MKKEKDERISCEVIRDLLPLYVDSICSQDSQNLIEEHMASCAECRVAAELLKKIEIKAVDDGGGEMNHQERSPKGVDYLKKVKKHTQKIILFLCSTLVLLMALIAWEGTRHYGMPLWSYYFLLPGAVVIFRVLDSSYISACEKRKSNKKMTAASLMLIVFMIGLIWTMLNRMRTGESFFGWSAGNMGLLIHYQLAVIGVLCGVILVAAIRRQVKTGAANSAVQVLSLTGCCMAMAFMTWQGKLNTLESGIASANRMIGVMLLESVVLLLVFFVLDKRKGNGNVF